MNGMNRAFIDAYRADCPATEAAPQIPTPPPSADRPPPAAETNEPKAELKIVVAGEPAQAERAKSGKSPDSHRISRPHFSIEALLADRDPEPAAEEPAAEEPVAEEPSVVANPTRPPAIAARPESGTSDPPSVPLTTATVEMPETNVPEPPIVEAEAIEEAFHPRWEVDGFRWPAVCRQLSETIGPELDHAAACLAELAGPGANVVAVGSSTRNRGATTLMLCLARAAAARGMDVAIVDADPDLPELASRLGVSVETSWQQVRAEVESLGEAAVRSAEEGIVLFASQADADVDDDPCQGDPAGVLRLLATRFDVVLVDVGPIDQRTDADAGHPLFGVQPSPLHKALLVVDARHVDTQRHLEIERLLSASGVETVAVMENFASRVA